jgi:hypothetical protein
VTFIESHKQVEGTSMENRAKARASVARPNMNLERKQVHSGFKKKLLCNKR